jgi:hypothetical protein
MLIETIVIGAMTFFLICFNILEYMKEKKKRKEQIDIEKKLKEIEEIYKKMRKKYESEGEK